MRRTLVPLLVLALVAAALASSADPREVGDTRVFAEVGEPGMPEGIAVGPDGLVYVSTHASVRGNAGEGPSKIFVYDASGDLVDEITIEGQNTAKTHGLLSMAFDAAGKLYVIDRNPPRIIRIDLSTEPPAQETYATIPDLPACRPVAGPDAACAPVTVDEPAFPDYFAFDAASNAYVTDLQAATIFRVKPAGALPHAAEIWFQSPLLDSIFGPNGIALDASGRTLYFAMTGSTQPATLTQGIIYTLPIRGDGSAGELAEFFRFTEPATGPDGIAFGTSGKLYVALAGSNQVSILNPNGSEAARFPTPLENAQRDVPYDLPASIAFLGRSILVTNQSFFAANPSSWAVFDVFVDDEVLPLITPAL